MGRDEFVHLLSDEILDIWKSGDARTRDRRDPRDVPVSPSVTDRTPEDHPVPGLGDPRLPDNIQVLEHEFNRLHRWFARNEDHFEMIR